MKLIYQIHMHLRIHIFIINIYTVTKTLQTIGIHLYYLSSLREKEKKSENEVIYGTKYSRVD